MVTVESNAADQHTPLKISSEQVCGESVNILSFPSPGSSPFGESHADEQSNVNENFPMKITSNYLRGPDLRDDNDNWEFPHPESLASTLIYGDTVGIHLLERNPQLSEDSLALPVQGGTAVKIYPAEGPSENVIANRTGQTPANLLDDETILLSSSASLLTDECERMIEPVTANVQYHRRKRLEWKLDNSQPISTERKPPGTGNSWTVYDDLLEELEESLENTLQTKDHSPAVGRSESFNGLAWPDPVNMSEMIEKYLHQRFLNFNSRADMCHGYCSSWPAKEYSDVAIMTEIEEKDEDDESQRQRKRQCLPLCRCRPAKGTKKL